VPLRHIRSPDPTLKSNSKSRNFDVVVVVAAAAVVIVVVLVVVVVILVSADVAALQYIGAGPSLAVEGNSVSGGQ
jgi:hypothetical protein